MDHHRRTSAGVRSSLVGRRLSVAESKMTSVYSSAALASTGARAIVIGASMAGLLIAAALARSGVAVELLDRDRLPDRPVGRRGVPQDSQSHILLNRGLTAIEELLPGFRTDLLRRGAVSADVGHVPWLSEHGWLEIRAQGLEALSATRPLMEAVVRGRVCALPGVRLHQEITVEGLRQLPTGWLVRAGTRELEASIVVDASGRSSRLAHWLPALAPPPEQRVDARVGYASRLFAARSPLPIRTGVMVTSPPEIGTAGLALPVEDGRWLVTGAGFGDRRPPRDEAGYHRFLTNLRDPAIADLVAMLEPVSEVRVHRQTANCRRLWDRVAGWPDGLLVVGDALCALNPVYGQGITVAAQQGLVVAAALDRGQPVNRRLQRRLTAVTNVPWSIATTADIRSPSCAGEPSTSQRLGIAWTSRLTTLAAAGNRRATRRLTAVNHLISSPVSLLHPALLLAGVGALPSTRLPRPAVLEELSRLRRASPPVSPAGA